MVCAGVNGPWRVDSHSTHVFDCERRRQLIEKDRENTVISSSPPVRRECKIT